MSVTDREVLSDVQSLLAEPRDGGQSYPSGMWTQAEMADYLADAQLALLAETGLTVSRGTIVCVPHLLRHDLPGDTLHVLRATWVRATDGRRFPLSRGDVWEQDAVRYGGSTVKWRVEPGTPDTFMTGDTPTRVVQLAPPPNKPGSLELTYIPLPASPVGGGAALSVPDDASVVLTWEAIAQALTKEGRAKDVGRAGLAAQIAELGTGAVELLLKGFSE